MREQGAYRAREHVARSRLRERRRAAREHHHVIGAFLVAVGDIGVGAFQHAYHTKGLGNKKCICRSFRYALFFRMGARRLDIGRIEGRKQTRRLATMRSNNRRIPRHEALAQRRGGLGGRKRRQAAAVDKGGLLRVAKHVDHDVGRRLARGESTPHHHGARMARA